MLEDFRNDPLNKLDPGSDAKIQQALAALSNSDSDLFQTINQASTAAGVRVGIAAMTELSGGQSAADLFAQEEIASAAAANRPVNGAVIPSGDDLRSRIETYLVNLYSALDGGHQQYEQTIRGELLPAGNLNVDAIRFGQGTFDDTSGNPGAAERGGFTPPFDAPTRALGGDPSAIAITASSAMGDIRKTWTNFGDKLNSNTKRTQLETQARLDQKRVNTLSVAKKELEGVLASPGSKTVGDPQKQLDQVNKEISRLEQQIASNQAQASQIPTS
jgi:hypothetical protein